MSEDLKHVHGEEGFERQDLSAQAIYAFLISLVVGGVLVYLVVLGLYKFMDARQRARHPQQSPLVQQVDANTRIVSPEEIKKFPEPRLERNERIEINDFRLKEEQTLNSYGWVDEKSGVVRIPIDRAMQLVAQRGLPTTPKAGTIPPSAVNVANQAAERSDTSGTEPPEVMERKVAVRSPVRSSISRLIATAMLTACALSASSWGQGMTQGILSPPANVRPPGLEERGH